MAFDPSAYDRSHVDYQKEPNLSEDQWVERFVARMKKLGETCAKESFKPEVEAYARDCASAYYADRHEYVDPEEAAETDVSYWESEE